MQTSVFYFRNVNFFYLLDFIVEKKLQLLQGTATVEFTLTTKSDQKN